VLDRTAVGAEPTWTPKPCPSDISEVARRLVLLANAVPPAHWVTYGDLAEAAGMGEAKKAARGAASALSFFPPGTPMTEWVLPWHRVRLEDGHLKSRESGVIVDPSDPANLLFVAEGGRLIGGAASQGRRYPLAAKVRTGAITL
jgi:alkylated DNA nucleotide flippase Atl1